MRFRSATISDCATLAELNHQLIRDEGHRNPMSVVELEERMKGWLVAEYRAVILEEGSEVVAYALFREEAEEVYLRQFFVVRERRRRGIGRRAMEILRSQVWPHGKLLTVEVLVGNEAGMKFWRSVGFRDYAMRMEMGRGKETGEFYFDAKTPSPGCLRSGQGMVVTEWGC